MVTVSEVEKYCGRQIYDKVFLKNSILVKLPELHLQLTKNVTPS